MSSDATLGAVVMGAIRVMDQMKADGLPLPERIAYLAEILPNVWPKPHDRSEPWKYRCKSCDDYGYEWRECPGDATCGPNPVTKAPRPQHGPHSYVVPCWCAAGQRFVAKAPSEPDELAQVGKINKPMTRFGR